MDSLRHEPSARTSDAEAAFRDSWYRGRDQLLDLRGSRFRTAALDYASALDTVCSQRASLIRLDATGVRDAESHLCRRELLASWLGDSVASMRGVRSTYGLVNLTVTEDAPSLLREVLAGPGAPFIEALELEGGRAAIAAWLDELAAVQHGWLGTLRVRQVHISGSHAVMQVSSNTIQLIVKGTPELRLLVVDGTSLLREFDHPTLRYLEVRGHDAVDGMAGEGAPFASVEVMKLVLAGGSAGDNLLPAQRFPALRQLDLSSNEPGPAGRNSHPDVSGLLRRLGVRNELETLILPSIRTREAAERLQLALSEMRNLHTVRIARTYGSRIDIRHETIRITIPNPSPWPAGDQLAEGALLLIAFPAAANDVRVPLGEAVRVMEEVFRDLSAEAQHAWTDLWRCVHELANAGGDSITWSTRDLVYAVGGCTFEWRDPAWRALDATCRRLWPVGRDASVRLNLDSEVG